jgi:hypothetical protein
MDRAELLNTAEVASLVTAEEIVVSVLPFNRTDTVEVSAVPLLVLLKKKT